MNSRHPELRAPVAILGAGPIGLACAVLLAQRGIDTEVVDARSLEQACRDRRLLALSDGTLQILYGLLGKAFSPFAPIHEVHVSSAGEFGTTRLSRADVGGTELGATAWYADLVQALARAAAAQPSVRMRRPCRVIGLEQRADSVLVQLDSGGPIVAPVAINAEGAAPPTGRPGPIAILADLDVSGLAPGVAVERFTRSGPLALLPVPQSHSRSMIWCLDHDSAQQMLALSDSDFRAQIQTMLGSRIGRVSRVGPRTPFSLVQQRRGRVREHRAVYIGNAAQSLHPMAGQGFNLSMRDCACLADCLAACPDDADTALNRYGAARYADRFAISGFTGWLPRTFAARSAPLAAARSASLLAIDLAAPLRRALASLLMYGLRS